MTVQLSSGSTVCISKERHCKKELFWCWKFWIWTNRVTLRGSTNANRQSCFLLCLQQPHSFCFSCTYNKPHPSLCVPVTTLIVVYTYFLCLLCRHTTTFQATPFVFVQLLHRQNPLFLCLYNFYIHVGSTLCLYTGHTLCFCLHRPHPLFLHNFT